MTAASPSRAEPAGAHLVDTRGRALPLLGARLRGDARGGMARVVLEQRFHNPYKQRLEVRYLLPLPADAAICGFSFSIDGRRIVGEVERVEVARERYDEALIAGRGGALLEQRRTSAFAQRVGNIPPGAEVSVEVTLDQPLRWIGAAGVGRGGWEWRFPTVVAPRYFDAAVSDAETRDARALAVPVAKGPLAAGVSLELSIRDAVAQGVPNSSSHRLYVAARRGGATRVALADVRLDRDVVIRWPVAGAEPGVSLDHGRGPAAHPRQGSAFGLLTIVPPTRERAEPVKRDMIILIDTSGSMGGEPLAQAKRAAAALVSSLDDGDRLEMIRFARDARRWRPGPITIGHRDDRAQALAWIRGLRAGGGTRMHDAIVSALQPLCEGAQRQVVLITDGHIGFESQVLGAVRTRLPLRSCVHAIGVGHAVNRALTRPLARVARGLEIILAPGEDVEPGLAQLQARSARPCVVGLSISGDALRGHVPRRLPDLFAEAPTKVAVELDPGGRRADRQGARAARSLVSAALGAAAGAWRGLTGRPVAVRPRAS